MLPAKGLWAFLNSSLLDLDDIVARELNACHTTPGPLRSAGEVEPQRSTREDDEAQMTCQSFGGVPGEAMVVGAGDAIRARGPRPSP